MIRPVNTLLDTSEKTSDTAALANVRSCACVTMSGSSLATWLQLPSHRLVGCCIIVCVLYRLLDIFIFILVFLVGCCCFHYFTTITLSSGSACVEVGRSLIYPREFSEKLNVFCVICDCHWACLLIINAAIDRRRPVCSKLCECQSRKQMFGDCWVCV